MAGDEEDKKQQPEGGEQTEHAPTPKFEVESPPAETQTGVPIQINSRLIDPESQMPGGEDFKEDASKTNYIIIQFTHPPSLDEERELKDKNVQFCSKISRTSWLAKYEPHELSPIRDLTFVVYANPYLEKLSLNPTLEAELTAKKQPHAFARRTVTAESSSSITAPDELRNVFIQLHPGSMAPEEMRTFLVSNHGIARERLFLQVNSLSTSLTADEILHIAKIDDVSGIHEEPRMTLQNHLISQVIKTREAGALAAHHLGSGLELDGKDEIIVFADSGLDNGIKDGGFFSDKRHPFFKGGRILHLDPRSDEKTGKFDRKGKCEDLAGHGTHVAGVALGSFEIGKPQKEINLQVRRLDGVAPGASVVMQNIIGCPKVDSNGKVTSDGDVSLARKDYTYESIFLDPYYGYPEGYEGEFPSIKPKGKPQQPKVQARIHSNSWGPSPEKGKSPGYTPKGELLDQVLYMTPDLFVVFCTGNSGDNKDVHDDFPDGQITGFASAKNAITVGACFNGNQYIKVQNSGSRETNLYDMYQSPKDGGQVMGPQNIPRFSSRGPIADSLLSKRIKPDVVAPGVAIYSANSTVRVTEPGYGLAPNPNKFCTFESGSSMAAPVVSGCAALLRQALVQRGHRDPSAALIKALIVNGAVDLSAEGGKLWKGNTTALGGCNELENEDIAPAPNNVQGWGRIDIADSIDNVVDGKLCGFEDIKLREGVEKNSDKDPRLRPDKDPADCHKFPVSIIPPANLKDKPNQKGNVKATLAWTDLPGEDLQNELTISLIFGEGDERNRVVDAIGAKEEILEVMAANNVQKLEVKDLVFKDGKAVDLMVVVTAVSLAESRDLRSKVNQAYAVCWKVWYS